MVAMAQQEAGQLLAGLTHGSHRRLTRTHKVADRLVGLVRNPDQRQFAGTVQLGEVDRIAPIGLDPVGATTTHSWPAAVSCRWMP